MATSITHAMPKAATRVSRRISPTTLSSVCSSHPNIGRALPETETFDRIARFDRTLLQDTQIKAAPATGQKACDDIVPSKLHCELIAWRPWLCHHDHRRAR